VKALEALADALDAPAHPIVDEARSLRAQLPSGELTAEKACLTVAALQPEHAIIVDEGSPADSPIIHLPLPLPRIVS